MSLTRVLARPLSLIVVALAAVSCGTPTAPLRAGTYVLRSIDGQTVPFSRTLVGGATVTYIADTIWFRADGTATEVGVERYVDPSIGQDQVVQWTSGYRYVVRGSDVEFTFSPPPCFAAQMVSGSSSAPVAASVEGQGEGGCSYVQPVGKLTREGLEVGVMGGTEWRRLFVRVDN